MSYAPGAELNLTAGPRTPSWGSRLILNYTRSPESPRCWPRGRGWWVQDPAAPDPESTLGSDHEELTKPGVGGKGRGERPPTAIAVAIQHPMVGEWCVCACGGKQPCFFLILLGPEGGGVSTPHPGQGVAVGWM